MCDSRKYPYPPHGGSRKFLGVWGSKGEKFPKGRRVHKEFFFPEGLKCDWMNTYILFPLLQVTRKTKSSIPWNRCKIPCHTFSIIIPAPYDTEHWGTPLSSTFDVESNKMADKKNIVPRPLTLAYWAIERHITVSPESFRGFNN